MNVKDLDPRFAKTVYSVEADSYAQHMLWQEFSKEAFDINLSSYKDKITPIIWKQDNPGRIYTVGYIKKRPINISCFWNILNSQYVLFWEACSQLVDYKMIEEFFEEVLGKNHKKINALNFTHVYHYLNQNT